jgi:hypothetical protein
MFNFKNLKIMNLENINLVELNAQEVQEIDGGNGVHSGGYGLAGNSNAMGDFVIGFFAGLLGY